MKALRFVAYALLLALAAFATALIAAIRNQAKIAEFALAILHQRSGYEIRIAGSRMGFGTHLVVILEHPRILSGGVEVATLDDIRAVLSIRAILHNNGLPLARLVLDHPRVKIPMTGASETIGSMPRLDARAVSALKWAVDALSGTVDQVDVLDALLIDEDNSSLVDRLDLRAYKRHKRRPGNWPWIVDFDALFNHTQVSGLRLTGSFSIGPQTNQPELIATGRAWFWGLDLRSVDLHVLKASAQLAGKLRLTYDRNGELDSRTEITANNLVLQPNTSAGNQQLGNYTASTLLKVSPDLLELAELDVRQGFSRLLVGKATLGHPFDDDRTLTFDVGGSTLDLVRVAQFFKTIGRLPSQLTNLTNQLGSGKLSLTRAAIDTTKSLRDWSFATLRHNLQIDAAITGLGYRFPSRLQLPPLTNLEVQLDYSSAVLKLTQGSSDIGDSHIEDLSAQANLQNAPRDISYKLQFKGDLDLTELYPAASSDVRAVTPAVADRIEKVEGHAPITVQATGNLNNQQWQTPSSYTATVELGKATINFKGAPIPIALRDGEIELKPDLVTIRTLRVVPIAAKAGSITVDGAIEPRSVPVVHNLIVRVDRITVEQWLPLFVSPDSIAADGPINGQLTVNSDLRRSGPPVVTGKLTLGTGHLQLGFLRSPIATQLATLTLDGKGLELEVPAGKLEGEPLDLSLELRDIAHPVLQIDATAAKLDFEVMTFIRTPWSPHAAPHFFAAPAYGHIEARQANFGKLPMSEVSTDFSRDSVSWHIKNFAAHVFGGELYLQLSGRSGPNNWINMVGTISNADAARPFLLSGETHEPPVTGRLFAKGDLWADTGTDFFNTLAGNLSLDVRDGKLNRFRLLTRILGLIDLKSWITAHFPDPRIAGLPFTTLSGDFKGKDGDFYTDNLRLQSPAMNMSSKGDVRLADGQVDMEVGLFPFDTANWIVHQIPIVGANLANGSSGLVAAYFHVHGPFKDPSVTPKPIHSVTEFVKKMLGLPINIIVPNTIK